MSIKRLIIILFECLFRFLKLRFKQKLDMWQEGKAIRNIQNCLRWHCNPVHEIKLLTLFWFLFIKLIRFHTKTKITFILKQLTPLFQTQAFKIFRNPSKHTLTLTQSFCREYSFMSNEKMHFDFGLAALCV